MFHKFLNIVLTSPTGQKQVLDQKISTPVEFPLLEKTTPSTIPSVSVAKMCSDLKISSTTLHNEFFYREAEYTITKLLSIEKTCSQYQQEIATLCRDKKFIQEAKQDTKTLADKVSQQLNNVTDTISLFKASYSIEKVIKRITLERDHFLYLKQTLLSVLQDTAQRYFNLVCAESLCSVIFGVDSAMTLMDDVEKDVPPPLFKAQNTSIELMNKTQFNKLFRLIAEIDENDRLQFKQYDLLHLEIKEIYYFLSSLRDANTFYRMAQQGFFAQIGYASDNVFKILEEELGQFHEEMKQIKIMNYIFIQEKKWESEEFFSISQIQAIAVLDEQVKSDFEKIKKEMMELITLYNRPTTAYKVIVR